MPGAHAEPSKCGLTTRETEGQRAAAQTEYATPMQHISTSGGTLLVKANSA
jgi:hypothetical protein